MAFGGKIKAVPQENAMKAVIYARYSSEKQTENSIDAQLRACHAYAELHGYEVIGEYIDRAKSGTTDRREDFQRMVSDAPKQQFAYIIVYRFDRFARNRYDSAIYKKQLEAIGVRVLSSEESVGTGDEGMILESIYEAMAESYSRRLSKIVSFGMRETALKGLSTGGNISYAMKIEDHRLVVDDRLAPAVRYCFEQRAAGKGKKKIADELNEMGYRTKTGKLFTLNTVTQIISNPVYKGVNDYCGIKRECPAIVSAELFDTVQARELEQKKRMGTKVSEDFFALGGKLYCGHCGTAMIGDSGTGRSGAKHYYYTCSQKKKKRSCNKRSEKKEELELYICRQTVERVLSEDNIRKIAKKVSDLSKEQVDVSELETLKKTLADIEKEIDALADALIRTTSDVMIKKLDEKADALDRQKKHLELEIDRMELSRDVAISEVEAAKYIRGFKDGDLHDEEFRRHLINAFINSVYVFDDKIVIWYNIKGRKPVTLYETLESIKSACGSDGLNDGPPRTKLGRTDGEVFCFVFIGESFGALFERGRCR